MLTALLMFSGCSLATSCDKDSTSSEEQKKEESLEATGEVSLLYMGQASIRIVTETGKVIYIDPYAGSQYDLAADLILVTHEHSDHIQGVGVLARRYGLPVYATPGTWAGMEEKAGKIPGA